MGRRCELQTWSAGNAMVLEVGGGLHVAVLEAKGELCAAMLVALASDTHALEAVCPGEPHPVEQCPCPGGCAP